MLQSKLKTKFNKERNHINWCNYKHQHNNRLKLVSVIFCKIFISHQLIAFQKLWKMFFISSKKLFLFSRYSDFSISVFPSYFPVQPLLQRLIKVNLKVYDVINCLNKNLITLDKEIRYEIETLSIDRVLNRKNFMEKSCRKCALKLSPRPLLNFGK